MSNNDSGQHGLPRSAKMFVGCLFGIALLLVVLDFVHPMHHPHFEAEKWHLFNAVFGFVSFALLVFVGKYILRPIVMRDEDYYDE